MYRYDEIDREVLADRVAEFREQCGRRLSGAILRHCEVNCEELVWAFL